MWLQLQGPARAEHDRWRDAGATCYPEVIASFIAEAEGAPEELYHSKRHGGTSHAFLAS